MIGRLRGEIVYKRPPQLLLDVNGVGYELEAPMSTFYGLPETGSATTLFTHLLVREDAHILYAFASEGEREMFRALLKVNGVGAKMALAILSGMNAAEFRRCVMMNDAAALTRLPGIGKKTAERLIVEMRDRVEKSVDAGEGLPPVTGGAAPAAVLPADAVEEAVQALIALGYKPQEASRMVSRVEHGDRCCEDIIRDALKASVK
ncbi:MAG TPA: Holliday junction branch migration protein RuvA [Thioalkalivibrio sp.]|nr:Holliday junction branch migration protein RuvA [Thioalkalivibrio sp.]